MLPGISVVIPVKNEVAKIRDCIEGILSQTVPVKEIIVIDSGSTDGTIQILKEYKQVTLIEIPSNEFNHGLTRNLGVSKTTGDFVLLTVGDAKPYNEFWIEELLKGFIDDDVVGVCGQQVVPHEKDKNPIEWFRPQSPPSLVKYQFPKGVLPKLSPEKQKEACGWDDVTAMYKREFLLKIPFQKTSYSEDAIWAKEALTEGYAIVYNTAARVYHYHLEDSDFTFKRALTTLYFRYKHFGILPKIKAWSLIQALRLLKGVFFESNFTIAEKIKWWQYNRAQQKSNRKAIQTFIAALNKGEQELDVVHEKYCGKPPIPLKTSI